MSGISNADALVDTGASESCIDSLLATELGLPVVDRRSVSGTHGAHPVNVHLAQVYVPTLDFTIFGTFAGVHLANRWPAASSLDWSNIPSKVPDGLRWAYRFRCLLGNPNYWAEKLEPASVWAPFAIIPLI